MAQTHVFETKMSKRMQSSFINLPVFQGIVNVEERPNLTEGEAVTRPYRSAMVAQDVSRGGSALTFQSITETNETLSVDTVRSVPFQIGKFDDVQSNFNLINEWSDDASRTLAADVDGQILAEVANATSTVDDGDFGGTSGSPLSLDTSNVLNVLFKASQKLREQNVDITGKDPRMDSKFKGGSGGYATLSPQFAEKLETYYAGRETVLGDMVAKSGYIMTAKSAGFDCFLTNQNYWTADMLLGTNPSDGDTITINGAVFTFKASPVLAGAIDIKGSAALTLDELVLSINAPGTTRAGDFIALSASDAALLTNVTASDGATQLDMIAKGKSFLAVSETMTAAADVWELEVQHNMFGKKGAIDMVSQAGPSVEVSDIPDGFGKYVKPYILYGKKTFVEGAKRMVDVQIDSSSF